MSNFETIALIVDTVQTAAICGTACGLLLAFFTKR